VPEDVVTRGEFSLLVRQVQDNAARLEGLDSTGTRGVGIVQVQLTDLSKDVARLTARMDTHEVEHRRDQQERKAARRWQITAWIALLAMLEGPIIYIISQLHK
jgi:hypothetical protein